MFEGENFFIQGFLTPNQPRVGEMAETQAQITAIRAKFERTETAEYFVKELFGFRVDRPTHSAPSVDDFVPLMRQFLYQGEKIPEGSFTIGKVALVESDALATLFSLAADHREQYLGETCSLRETTNRESAQMASRIYDFIALRFIHFVDFADYLAGEQFLSLRNDHRPLLQAFSRNRMVNVETAARRKAFGQAILEPTCEDRERFFAHLSRNGFSRNGHNPQSIPELLQPNYRTYVNTQLAAASREIEKRSKQFQIHPIITAWDIINAMFTVEDESPQEDGSTIKEGGDPKPLYGIMRNGKILEGENLHTYIQNRADELSKNNGAMVRALERLVASLRQNPLDPLRARKLRGWDVEDFSGRRRKTYRFRGKGLGLGGGKEPGRVRIIWHFDLEDPNIIVIDDIVHHDTLDSMDRH